MVQQVTQGIKITVDSRFEGTFRKQGGLHHAFSYLVTIHNQSKESVQLTSRHWKVRDSLHRTETVDGEGVIGKKPVLRPGECHQYQSGCLLHAPVGAMSGFYTMVNLVSTRHFRVAIPSFILCAPFAIN